MTTQPEPEKQSDTEKMVTDYLREHPDFFANHEELLRELVLTHHTGGAVSLIERQVDILRDDNRQLRNQVRDMIEIARTNEELSGRILKLAELFAGPADLESIFGTLYAQIKDDFGAYAVSTRLFIDSVSGTDTGSVEFAGVEAPEKKLFATLAENRQPICGRLKAQQIAWLFGDNADKISSAVMLPLYGDDWSGVLAIGSADAKRFHSGMGTDLLAHLAAMFSIAIKARLSL